MASKRRRRRSDCVKKYRHETKEKAETALKRMLTKNARAGKFFRMHKYVCDHCGGWHIGHLIDRRPKKRRKHFT